MFTQEESAVLFMCLEWFLYGIYSGIFTIYLQYVSKDSRTTTIVFYALCVLYVLSTATVASDVLYYTIEIMHIGTSPDSHWQSLLFRVSMVRGAANGCCDFIAQCTLIYRCWIVWGKNIWVLIIPSFLAITYIATWIGSDGATIAKDDEILTAPWGNTLVLTGLVASMVVNALVTGLIVFKILKVLLEVKQVNSKATLAERALSLLNSTAGGPKYRQIIIIIIESGMVLFAIQLVRVAITSLIEHREGPTPRSLITALNIVIYLHQMLNGIAPTVILVRVQMGLSFDDDESFKESVGSLKFNNPPSNPDSLQSSSSIMPPEDPNEDPNIILEVRREPVGSSSLPQDRSEDT